MKYNDPKCGYVTRFRVRTSFIDRYERSHQSHLPHLLWAEWDKWDLLRQIEVIAEFKG